MATSMVIIFHEGNISTIFGKPGSGKTNLATVFMEKLVELGFHVYTNINFFKYEQVGEAIRKRKLRYIKGHVYRKKPEEIHIITSVSELLIGLLTTEKNVVILDETGIFGSSATPNSKKVRSLKELAFIIRHLSASLCLLAQSKGSIVPDLRSTLVEFEIRIYDLGYGHRMMTIATAVSRKDIITGEEIVEFEVADGDEYHNIPPTHLPFDSKFLPAFDIDIDLTESLKRLSKYNSIDVMVHGAEIIRELVEENKNKKGSKSHATRADERREARKLFVEKSEENPTAKNKFLSRKELLVYVAKKFDRTYQWSLNACSGLKFQS